MPENRPWYREPETFIALTALIVSISAVVVGIYEASLQRAHDRAEVWPHVELSTYTSPKGAYVSLTNNGIGPAVVNTIVVFVDGKPHRDWPDAMEALLGRPAGSLSVSTALDHGIRAGDRIELLALLPAQMPPDFWNSITRVSLKVCYASVFGESWELSAHLGARDTWRPVDRCPPQPAKTEF